METRRGGAPRGSSLLARLVFEIQQTGPLTLSAVVGTLAGAALVAGDLPAPKTIRIGPHAALRATEAAV